MLKELILAYLISAGTHTAGHFEYANKNNIGMRLDGITEVIDNPKDQYHYGIIASDMSGFVAQDILSNARKDKTQYLANALYKTGYYLYFGRNKDIVEDMSFNFWSVSVLTDYLNSQGYEIPIRLIADKNEVGLKYTKNW